MSISRYVFPVRHLMYFIKVNVKSYSNVVYNRYNNVPVSDGTIVVIFARCCLLWKENVEGKVQVVV